MVEFLSKMLKRNLTKLTKICLKFQTKILQQGAFLIFFPFWAYQKRVLQCSEKIYICENYHTSVIIGKLAKGYGAGNLSAEKHPQKIKVIDLSLSS